MSELKYMAESPDGKTYRSTSISGIKRAMRRDRCTHRCPIKLTKDKSYIGQNYRPMPWRWKR